MFAKTSIKKTLILFVALLACTIFVFSACTTSNKFTPVEKPASATVEGNGGIAVRYGDYIYYVNGYQSSYGSANGYTSDIRTGAIVRIKIADLEKIIRINAYTGSTSSKITDAITKVIAGRPDAITNTALQNLVVGINGAEMVVPNYYYTGNTDNTALNGIYIFNDRIYITTPNNELDANGNILNSQLVLASYDLGGGNMQRHFVFDKNSPVLKLSQIDGKVCATYVLDSKLCTVTLTDKVVSESTVICENISSSQFTDNYVYFLDEDGSICQYEIGATEHSVLVKNEVEEGHEGHSHANSYTIKAVNGAYVYYTASEDTQSKLYFATSGKQGVALSTVPTSFLGWGEKIVFTATVPEQTVSMYGIWTTSGNGSDKTQILDPAQNGNSITLNKLEGNVLYYTTNSVSYKLDLAVENAEPQAYAYSLSTSATGWSVPDVLTFTYNNETVTYVFTLSSGSVSLVKFNPATNNNYIPNTTTSSSTTITLTVVED